MDGASPLVIRTLLAAVVYVGGGPVAVAQTVPFADTEDATLSDVDVGPGRIHPIVTIDLRNGDYARGAYDDDDADLARVPVHVAIGGAITLAGGGQGERGLFLIGQSSNGFHAPSPDERTSPRSWYESNNLVGLIWRTSGGLSAGATYTIKTSPNGVASTTHEASFTALYVGDDGLGKLQPKLAVTRRTRGDGGWYTIAGISPSIDLTQREDGPALSLPVLVGVGWNGFYGAGSGTRLYGSGGASVAQPLTLGRAKATLQLEVLALVRDDRLRRLDAPNGTTATVVPYGTLSIRTAW